MEWQKSLGGSDYDYVSSVQQTADGGYIVAGKSSALDGEVTGGHGGGYYYYDDAGNEYWYPYSDYWIVKLDASGTIEWQKSLGGSYDDRVSSIQQTSDGGYIVAGTSSSNNGD